MVFIDRTIDMPVPTLIYPDICWTPGVVSHTPESVTNWRDTSGLTVEVKRVIGVGSLERIGVACVVHSLKLENNAKSAMVPFMTVSWVSHLLGLFEGNRRCVVHSSCTVSSFLLFEYECQCTRMQHHGHMAAITTACVS